MAIDKTKIFSATAHLYVAARTDPNTPVSHTTSTGWSDVGTLRGKSAKIDTEVHETLIHTGEMHQTGVTLKFEAEALECDASKFSLLETLLNKRCDVILKPIGSTRCWKLLGLNLTHGFKGTYTNDDVLSIPLKGQVQGTKVTDCFIETTVSWSL